MVSNDLRHFHTWLDNSTYYLVTLFLYLHVRGLFCVKLKKKLFHSVANWDFVLRLQYVTVLFTAKLFHKHKKAIF